MRILLFIVVLIVTSCGRNGVFDTVNTTYPYEIDFTAPGCTTGRHGFKEKADYCEALRSRSLNNNCAYQKRKEAYELTCGPVFLEAP